MADHPELKFDGIEIRYWQL